MSRNRAFAFVLMTAAALGGCGSSHPPIVSASTLPVAPAPTVLPEPPADPGPPDLGPLAGAVLTVPAWGAGGGACPTGRIPVGTGQYVPATGKVVNLMSLVTSDVDGDGVDDYVVHLMCGEGPESPGWQVVAFRLAGEELDLIGRVIGSQDGLRMLSGLEAREGGRIAANVAARYTDSGQQFVPHQWREFDFQGGRFRQVDGPTSFPVDPPAARLSVDPADLVLRPAQGGHYIGELTATARNEGDAAVANAVLTLILPLEIRPAGEAWRGCVMSPLAISFSTLRIDCRIGGMAARTSRSITFDLVAVERPRVMGSNDSGGYEPSNHYLRVDQLPPYTFQDPQITEADIRISLADATPSS